MLTFSPGLALPSNPDLQLLEELIARQPIEALEALARRHFTPSALQRRRLAERDAAIRGLAIGRLGSGRELAGDISRELLRYRPSGYRFEQDPPVDSPRRAKMHRVLTLNGAKAPSEVTIRRALAGVGGSKSAPAMIQRAAYSGAKCNAEEYEDARVAEGDRERPGRDRRA